jgi:hypothetical protein
MLDLFVEGCLTHIGDPDGAIDWALGQLDLEPAPDNVADELLANSRGLAWIDPSASGGVTLAVSTSTYHCAVAASGLKSEIAWGYFSALILKLEEARGEQSDLSQTEIPGDTPLLQTFAVFQRADGYETTLDVTRPEDPEASGPARFAATVSRGD